ncbi:hypothetical protein NQ094_25205 [Enterobacter kobei]|uniref:hypothetical protein n=1 Tax=Enterobacter kobei TaxID=208224 RepID=UPI00214A5E76|nr:hypothetical protein [Enterobacter kobei]MCR2799248.1 hypothetical protein [Enterobacter kobei]
MKSFDKGQLAFLLLATLPVAWMIATVAVYPLNGIGLIQTIKTWRVGMLWTVLTDSHVRHDIWLNGIKALGVGLVGAMLMVGVNPLREPQTQNRAVWRGAVRHGCGCA